MVLGLCWSCVRVMHGDKRECAGSRGQGEGLSFWGKGFGCRSWPFVVEDLGLYEVFMDIKSW